MTWIIAVGLTVLLGYAVAQTIRKSLSGLPQRNQLLFWNFLFCTALSLLLLFFQTGDRFIGYGAMAVVFGLGFVNGFANYCQWRALAISLSKTSVLTWGDDLTAIALGFIVLGESRYLQNPALVAGLILCVVAVALFQKRERPLSAKKGLLFWVALYSVIWGVAMFSHRYFGLQGLGLAGFLLPWYGGSLVFSAGLTDFSKQNRWPERKHLLAVGLLSLSMWGALLFMYWSRILAPITVTQPVFQIGEMAIPFLIGLYLFKEEKQYGRLEIVASALGLAGGILLALAY